MVESYFFKGILYDILSGSWEGIVWWQFGGDCGGGERGEWVGGGGGGGGGERGGTGEAGMSGGRSGGGKCRRRRKNAGRTSWFSPSRRQFDASSCKPLRPVTRRERRIARMGKAEWSGSATEQQSDRECDDELRGGSATRTVLEERASLTFMQELGRTGR